MNAPAFELWTVAEAAGLNPKGRGRNFELDCPDCGRNGKASGSRGEGGPWHCFVCDAKGNALTLARRFEIDGAKLRDRPAPPPVHDRGGWAPETIRAGWRALEACRDTYAEHLAAYLRDGRGWPADLAAAGAAVPGWAWIPTDRPEVVGPFKARAEQGRPLAFALRDERGEVWTVSTRCIEGSADGKAKALRVSVRGAAGSGRLAIFGSIPDAVAAAARGEPIYLCEGSPDWLKAAAFCRLEARGAAIGAHDASGLPKLAEALRAALAAARVPAYRARVYCAPHIGDPADIGETKMLEAADALVGAATVYTVRLALDDTGKADLDDATPRGVADLRAVFNGAHLVHTAPVDVRDGAPANAAIDAAVLKASLAGIDGPNTLALVVVPAGVGKSEAALKLAADKARQGCRVVFLAESHKLAGELAERFANLAPDVTAEHVRGMRSACELLQAERDKRRADALATYAEHKGRRMCDGCPRRSDSGGSCEGWNAPTAERGRVTFAAHAAAASLMADPEPTDLVILDELPRTVSRFEVDGAELQSLESGALAARGWHRTHPAHGAFAARLRVVAERLALDYRGDGEYAERRPLAAVLEALRADPDALDAAADLVGEGAGDKRPPLPSPAMGRAGAADKWPDVSAWTLARELARLAIDAGAELAPEVADDLCLRIEADGGWAFEARTVFKLPAGVRVLALDATGIDSLAEWAALAAPSGRGLEVVNVPAVGHLAESAHHYRTERLRTGRLWARDGRRVAFLDDAPGAIQNALFRAAGGVPCAVGILTHKPAADALRWGVNLAADSEASPPTGCAFGEDDDNARAVAELAAELTRKGYALEIGHFGRDERGTNTFERVAVMAVLGTPRGDVGATRADAAALGMDGDELVSARAAAATVQALARGRHLRRPGVRLFLAADCDAPNVAALPGVTWTVEAANRAHAPTLDSFAAELRAVVAVAVLAERAGVLNVARAVAELRALGVSRRVAERLAVAEAARRGWRTFRIGPTHRVVWAPDLETAIRENVNDYAALPAHSENVALFVPARPPVPGEAPEAVAPLLGPMSGERPVFVGEFSDPSVCGLEGGELAIPLPESAEIGTSPPWARAAAG